MHPKVEIGKNCTTRLNTMLGGSYGKPERDGNKFPRLGDNISIGPSSAIFGPVTIGNNTIIGANAVVTSSVPENSVVGSLRAKL